jgi:integrase
MHARALPPPHLCLMDDPGVVPLPVIQQHLGHESIQTTIGVYGHLDRTSAQAAADAIGSALALSAVTAESIRRGAAC